MCLFLLVLFFILGIVDNLGSFVCLVGWFLNVLVNYYVISRTDPKTERLTILRAVTHETELGGMVSVSAGHIILTPTQPVGSGRPQGESNPVPPHQESRALLTELPRLPIMVAGSVKVNENKRGGGGGGRERVIVKFCWIQRQSTYDT